MYFESQTIIYASTIRSFFWYVFARDVFPFFIQLVLEGVDCRCLDHFAGEIVPSPIRSEVKRVELSSPYTISRYILHQLKIVFSTWSGLLTKFWWDHIFIIAVDVVEHLYHVTSFFTERQCWQIQFSQTFFIGKILQSVNQFGSSYLNLFTF